MAGLISAFVPLSMDSLIASNCCWSKCVSCCTVNRSRTPRLSNRSNIRSLGFSNWMLPGGSLSSINSKAWWASTPRKVLSINRQFSSSRMKWMICLLRISCIRDLKGTLVRTLARPLTLMQTTSSFWATSKGVSDGSMALFGSGAFGLCGGFGFCDDGDNGLLQHLGILHRT